MENSHAIWDHSVTCYLAEVRFRPLPPAEAGTWFSELRGMQGWVDLCYVKADQPGIKPVSCKSSALPLSYHTIVSLLCVLAIILKDTTSEITYYLWSGMLPHFCWAITGFILIFVIIIRTKQYFMRCHDIGCSRKIQHKHKYELGLPFPPRNLPIKFGTNPSTIFLVIMVTDTGTHTNQCR